MKFLRLLGYLLLTTLWTGTANADIVRDASAKGIVVPIGGALRYDNAEVWSRLVDLAGGKGARFVILPTASGNPQRVSELVGRALRTHGAEVEVIPLSAKWPKTDSASVARDPEWVAAIDRANGVFITGGAQERIVDALLAPEGPTPVLMAIRRVLDRDGVIAGTSAGAAVMSDTMFRDAQDVHRVLKGRLRQGIEIDRGLGFVGPSLFIDQHFLRRGRVGRMLPLMQAKGYTLGLGVEENSAAIIRRGQVEVIGAKGALLVDLSQSRHKDMQGIFNVENARLSYLDRGDRFDFVGRIPLPSDVKLKDHKLDWAAPGFKPYFENNPYYMDILGDQAIANAMANLMDNKHTQAVGLAFQARPDKDEVNPNLGFEFILTRDDKASGWFTGSFGGEDYSVFNMRLDVRPVRVAQPLYSDWK